MSIPPVPRERILAAMAQFDRELRGGVDWQGWEDNRAQRYAVEDGGRRYPPKQLVSMAAGVPVSDFSGGKETNEYLASLGFQVIPINRRAIASLLEQILDGYPAARAQRVRKGDSAMAKLFERTERDLASQEEVGRFPTISVKAGSGFGEWARVPWIAFLDSRETRSTQEGVYVVLLFRQDCSGFYLTLNQGVNELRDQLKAAGAAAELRRRAAGLRTKQYVRDLSSRGFALDDRTDLRAGVLGDAYEASTIAHKLYEKGGIPDDQVLIEDLQALLEAYDRYLSERDVMATVHLLLKWRADKEPRTIERHKDVVDREGSVWWGKMSSPGMSSEKIAAVRGQLAKGAETFVFLSGAGTMWRARLEELTVDPGDVDDRRFPGYYKREDCTFFCRLSRFETSSRDWVVQNTVLDNNPVPGSAKDAIVSSANPAYLRLVGTMPRAWIFQANPDYFDVRGAIKNLPQFTWLVKRHATEMAVGDRVYLWESGDRAGIVGVAEIGEAVRDREMEPEALPYILQGEKFSEPQPRAALKILNAVDPELPRRTLQAHPVLANLSVIRQPQGTNYSVSADEHKEIDKLLNASGGAAPDGEASKCDTERLRFLLVCPPANRLAPCRNRASFTFRTWIGPGWLQTAVPDGSRNACRPSLP